MRRNLLLFATTALIAFTLTGCNQETPQNKGDSGEDKPLRLAWLGNPSGGLYPKNDSLVVKKINEQFGVAIEIVEVDSTNQQAMNMLYASGEIPNHFLVHTNGIHTLFKQDLTRTIPVDMIKEAAPNLWKSTLENYPQIENMSIYQEGKLLALPQGTRELFPFTVVRTDWLEKVGASMPANLEEFKEVARLFTEEDPDGNGKDDTYAMSITGFSDVYNIAAAYGISLPGGVIKDHSWLKDKDGQLIRAEVSENYKEMLLYLADLYAKGYIHPDITVEDNEALFSDGVTGTHTAGWTSFMPDYRPSGFYALLFKKNPKAKTEYLPALAGPNGEKAVYEKQSAVWRYSAISKDTTDEQLKKILQILDAQITDMKFHNLVWRGVEGTHYTLNKDGMAVATKEYATNEKQAGEGLKFFILNNRTTEQMNISFGSEGNKQRTIQNTYKSVEQLIPSGTILQSEAEYGADVEKVEHEFFFNVITGNVDMKTSWDKYVKNWYAAGGNEMTKEVNQVYQSYNN